MDQPARKNINGPVRQKNVSRLLRCKKDLAELPVKAKLAFCPLSSTVSHSDSLSLYFSVPLPRCSFTPFLFYVVTHKICRYWRNALSRPLVFLSRLSVLRRSILALIFVNDLFTDKQRCLSLMSDRLTQPPLRLFPFSSVTLLFYAYLFPTCFHLNS